MSTARPALTAAAFLLEVAHLAWEHLHGGVVSHHLLANPDLPAISNWFGLLLIPALTWFLVGRIERRIASGAPGSSRAAIVAGFAAALVYGASLALALASKFGSIDMVFFALFAIGLVVPIYRAQFVLGFVLGMTFTFGAVLPTIIASVFAAYSSLAHLVFRRLYRLAMRRRASNG